MATQFKSFDPHLANAMSDAFTAAWKSLTDSDSPATFDGSADWARETLAMRIIESAQAGEHDVDRLRDDALAFLTNSKNEKQAYLSGSEGSSFAACSAYFVHRAANVNHWRRSSG